MNCSDLKSYIMQQNQEFPISEWKKSGVGGNDYIIITIALLIMKEYSTKTNIFVFLIH